MAALLAWNLGHVIHWATGVPFELISQTLLIHVHMNIKLEFFLAVATLCRGTQWDLTCPMACDTIVLAVKFANPNWPVPADGQVHLEMRAHNIRAVSKLWAYFRGVPVADICKAACWKSPTIFSLYYLRDMLWLESISERTVLISAK